MCNICVRDFHRRVNNFYYSEIRPLIDKNDFSLAYDKMSELIDNFLGRWELKNLVSGVQILENSKLVATQLSSREVSKELITKFEGVLRDSEIIGEYPRAFQ